MTIFLRVNVENLSWRMKRIITAILAIIYFGASTGATIHQHYCMGKLASWGLGYDQISECGKCGMDEGTINETGCCKDEHTFIKSEDDQKTAEIFSYFTANAGNACVPDEIKLALSDPLSTDKGNSSTNGPPRWSGVAVYLFKRTLLI